MRIVTKSSFLRGLLVVMNGSPRILEDISFVACQIQKIKFGDTSEQQSARLFYDAICGFIIEHNVEQIGINHDYDLCDCKPFFTRGIDPVLHVTC